MVEENGAVGWQKSSGYAECLSLEFGPFETVHRWRRMPECDEFVGARRSKHTVVAYKDGIYVFGGDNGKVMLNDLLRFDVKEKSWGCAFSSGNPPSPRYHHSAVVHDSSMFVFGGFTGDIQGNSNLKNQNDLFEYKFHMCQWIKWEFSGKAPVPRSAHGAAVYDNKLWIFAGYDGNFRLNDMWTINLKEPNNVVWEEVNQLGTRPPTCCNFPVAVARDSLYVFSGQSGAKFTNSLFYFQFNDKCWTRISYDNILSGASPPPSRRYGHTMVAFDSYLYVFGGAADSALPNDLYCFDLDTEAWSVISPSPDSEIPPGRLFHASAVVGDAMYIFGGTGYNNIRSGDMYRFQISNYPKCTLCDDFGKLLESGMFADIELVVGPEEEKIRAHVAFVAARSPYLRDRILEAKQRRPQSPTNESENEESKSSSLPLLQVRLETAVPLAIRLLLYYIYTDKIKTTSYKDSADQNQIVLIMMDVYCLAVQYMMPRLEYLCVQYLESKICIENVLLLLCSASRLNFQFIQDYCLRFIVRDCNFNQVVMSDEFERLDKYLIVEIIRRKQMLQAALLPPQTPNASSLEKTLAKDLERFLMMDGHVFCDITLLVEDEEFGAHKAILATRCSYFEAMFRSFMPKDGRVKLTFGHIVPSRQAVQSLLKFIYYGDVNMPPDDALYLFSAPFFFGFTNNRIQAFCKENLEMKIESENLIRILEAADRIRACDLKNHTLNLIVRDFSKVAKMDQLQHLSKSLLLDILQALAAEMNDSKMCSDLSSINFTSDNG